MRWPGGGRVWATGRLWWPCGVLVALIVGAAASRDVSRWKGDWWWGYDHLGQALPVLLVVVAAAAAWDAGSADNGVAAWSARLPDARWKVPFSVVGKTLAVTVVLYLIAVAAVVAITVLNQGEVRANALLVLGHHVGMIGFAAALGLGIGATLPSLYAVIATLGVLAVLLLVPSGGAADRVFEIAGTAGSVGGAMPITHREVWMVLALVVSAFVLGLIACLGGSRRVLAAASVVLAAVPLQLAGSVLPTGLFMPSDEPPGRCAQSTIQVCVYPGYDGLLAPVHDNLVSFMAVARKRGIETKLLPQVYRQDSGAALPVGVGTIALWGNKRTTGDPGVWTTAMAVSTPLWCPSMFGDVAPMRLLKHRQLVLDWALVVLGDKPADEFEERYRLDPDSGAAAAQVNAALRTLQSCG